MIDEPLQLYGRAFVNGSIDDDTLMTIERGLIARITRVAHPPANAETYDGVLVPLHEPAGAVVHFDGDDPQAGPLIRYTKVTRRKSSQ